MTSRQKRRVNRAIRINQKAWNAITKIKGWDFKSEQARAEILNAAWARIAKLIDDQPEISSLVQAAAINRMPCKRKGNNHVRT